MDFLVFLAGPFIQASERQNFRNKLEAFEANCADRTEFDCDDYPFHLDDEDTEDLGDALRQNTHVTKFSLNIRNIDAPSAAALTPFLRENPSLQKLVLKGTSREPRRSAQVIHCLLHALSQNEHLQNLELLLQETEFCVQPFYDLLRSTSCLKHLVLAVCEHMSPADGQHVAEALAENTSLQTLTLTQIHYNLFSPILEVCTDHPTISGLHITHVHGMMEQVRDVLDCNPRIQCLCLADTNLDRHDLQLLAESFARTTSVTKLEMWRCEIEDAVYLKDLIRSNHSLQTLDLSETRLNNTDVSELVQGLYRNTSVHFLDLSGNGITEGQALKNLLRRNKSLQCLDLHRNSLQAGAAAELAQGLQYCKNLQRLDISACNLGDSGVISIAQSLRTNTSLTLLVLAYNDITVLGVRALAQTLENNHTLATLVLNANNLSGESSRVLAELLRNNSTLQDLRLDGCHINGGDVVPIFEALETNCTLEYLDLESNSIWREGFLQLARSLPSWKGLKRLLVTWDDSFSDMETTLVKGFEQNRSLREVRFTGDFLQSENMDKLLFYLERNTLDPLLAASTDEMPLGLWPTVFEGSTPSRVFHCLCEKPSLLSFMGGRELPASPIAQKPSNSESPGEENRMPNRKRRRPQM